MLHVEQMLILGLSYINKEREKTIDHMEEIEFRFI